MQSSVLQSHLKQYYASSFLKELDPESLSMIPQFKNKDKKEKQNMKTFLIDSQNLIQETAQNQKENYIDFLEAKIKASSKEIIKNFKDLSLKQNADEEIDFISVKSFIMEEQDLDLSTIRDSKIISSIPEDYSALYSSIYQSH